MKNKTKDKKDVWRQNFMWHPYIDSVKCCKLICLRLNNYQNPQIIIIIIINETPFFRIII